MVDVSKFYKTEKIEINGEELEIRAYRVGDGPLVADLLANQFEMEELAEKDDSREKTTKISRLRVEQEELSGILGQRGLKRSLNPEMRKLHVEDLDMEEDIEIDPEHLVLIAWTMIWLGIPPVTKADDKKKKGMKKKKSGVKKTS
jgi:hypothetical protein